MVDAQWLRRLGLEDGADDVGFVSIGRPELDDQREDILRLFPWTKGLVSIVCKMNVVESKNALDYRRRVSDSETSSVWQSLGFGPNCKATYCMAVCPAGEDVIGPFLWTAKGTSRQWWSRYCKRRRRSTWSLARIPRPMRPSGSRTRGPSRSATGCGPARFAAFWRACLRVFQRNQSAGLAATYHFTFTGHEPAKATVVIRDKTIRVEHGHAGSPDLHVTADSRAWLGFLRKERSLVWALLTRKIRLNGSPRLLLAFGRCFPS